MYVVLEGIKGVGKSTQFEKLQQWFAAQQWQVQYLCPTKPMPQKTWWEDMYSQQCHDDAFLAELYAARANYHAQQVCFERSWVVGDRSILTSCVTRLPLEQSQRLLYLDKIMKMEYNMRMPDHVIFLDHHGQFDLVTERLAQRERHYGTHDEQLHRLQQAYAGYAFLENTTHPAFTNIQWHHIDVLQDIEQVHQDIIGLVQQWQHSFVQTH